LFVKVFLSANIMEIAGIEDKIGFERFYDSAGGFGLTMSNSQTP
jgi:hypothetical protein